MNTLEKNNKEIYKKIMFPRTMIMTTHDKMVYVNPTSCHICNDELREDRMRDHYYLSGKFSCAAHEVCSLKYKVPTFFPVLCFIVYQAVIVIFLLKHWEIGKEIFLVYQIMKKTTFLLRGHC